LGMAGSRARALVSITMVRNFPEPVVCQITPPGRRSSLRTRVMRASVAPTAKYC